MAHSQIVFAIIENLTLEKNTTFNYFDWTITNDNALISKNIPNQQAVIYLAGQIFGNMLFERTIAFKFFSFENNIVPVNFMHEESNSLNSLLSLIWIHFENSIYTSIQICQDCEKYHVQVNRRNDFKSNTTGKYNNLNLSNDNIALIYDHKLSPFIEPLLLSKNIDKDNIPIKKIYSKSTAHSANLENAYMNFTRTQRSFLILTIARTTSFLPMKIAFYINFLECLLMNDNLELNFKLQIYTANFIGNTKTNKVHIRNIINKAYGIRSSFFHGSKVKANKTQLEEISTQLDTILRKTLIKAIRMENIFNNKDTSLLNKHLNSILYQ